MPVGESVRESRGMAEKVVGKIFVQLSFGGRTARVAMNSGGDWSLVNPGAQTLVPKDQNLWAGAWEMNAGRAILLPQSGGYNPVFSLRDFHFPPDSGDRSVAYMGKAGVNQVSGAWEPVLTDELLRLKIEECEQIQEEIKQIAIDMGLSIASVYDPTPACGILLAGRALARGDILEGVLGCALALPYLGDLVGWGPFAAIQSWKLERLTTRLEAIASWIGKEKQFATATTRGATAASGEAAPLTRMNGAAVRITQTSQNTAPLARMKSTAERVRMMGVRRLAPTWKNGGKTPSVIAREAEEAIPVMRNPRQIAKHANISHEKLVKEIESKGFVQVQKGSHGRRGGAEKSDIWVRRKAGDNGQMEWEAVRIDIRTLNPQQMQMAQKGKTPFTRQGQAALTPMSPGARQGIDKSARQVHMRLGHATNPEPVSMVAADLNAGKLLKGDYTHWHHEVFSGAPGELEKYLLNTAGQARIKLDFSGRVVTGR